LEGGCGEGFDWWMGGGRGGTIEFQRILKREIVETRGNWIGGRSRLFRALLETWWRVEMRLPGGFVHPGGRGGTSGLARARWAPWWGSGARERQEIVEMGAGGGIAAAEVRHLR
jgi:hypothetical protein